MQPLMYVLFGICRPTPRWGGKVCKGFEAVERAFKLH
eukprot:SAG31_NODE_20307_length_578_cov_0.929019_1_plen_36_part_10